MPTNFTNIVDTRNICDQLPGIETEVRHVPTIWRIDKLQLLANLQLKQEQELYWCLPSPPTHHHINFT